MKIAIASNGKNLDSEVDPRFGRCASFLLVDSQSGEFEVLTNEADRLARGAGVSAAQLVANKGVGAVMAGNFGPKAVAVLSQAGVDLIPVSGKTAREALDEFKAGKLKPATGPVPAGRDGGFGRRGRYGEGGR